MIVRMDEGSERVSLERGWSLRFEQTHPGMPFRRAAKGLRLVFENLVSTGKGDLLEAMRALAEAEGAGARLLCLFQERDFEVSDGWLTDREFGDSHLVHGVWHDEKGRKIYWGGGSYFYIEEPNGKKWFFYAD